MSGNISPTIEIQIDGATVAQSQRVGSRLKLYFAVLSCLGGLVLSAGSGTETIPVIAIFFAVFGYLFVDCFQLFALPPIAAYAAMALAALYCVSDFADLDAPGNQQMIAVAQLLVFVQAILMLQKKTRRIFEQLGVFCLLELVVAGVFNNAINYGLLLIPIGIVGAFALSLLSVLSASEGLGILDELEADDDSINFLKRDRRQSNVTFTAADSARSIATAASRLPRVAMFTLAPSVLLVGAIFFYGLPRTKDAAQTQSRGNAVVGFNDELRLEQLGEMLQSTQPAVRLYLTDQRTGQPYQLTGPVYLRGAVLESYRPDLTREPSTATWRAAQGRIVRKSPQLPGEYRSTRPADINFFDSVKASVVCESMRNRSLFSVAPYHYVNKEPAISHQSDRWTLTRAVEEELFYPRKEYTFGTHAFHLGKQSELVTRHEDPSLFQTLSPSPQDGPQGSQDSADTRVSNTVESIALLRRKGDVERRQIAYDSVTSAFDIDAMPTVAQIARSRIKDASGRRRTDYQIAKAMEQYLATSPDFSYTLDLRSESIPGMDPIEQFVAVDRKGHCQFFASALVMMLRSEGIPARIVVGYRTEEFNELGNYYVARQLHAHAWVEALISREQLNLNRNVYGQVPSDEYWLRLDPTPAGSLRSDSAGGVVQMLDVAQNIWDDYVLDMDVGRQDNVLLGGSINPMSQSYGRMVDWLSLSISRIRAGELGGGSLASRQLFSWPAAVLGVVMAMAAVILLRVRFPAWILSRMEGAKTETADRPSIAFYATTLDQLARVGVRRDPAQTPAELAECASASLQHPTAPSVTGPLSALTSAFYHTRYGQPAGPPHDLAKKSSIEHARQLSPEVEQALADLTRSIDLMVAQSTVAQSTVAQSTVAQSTVAQSIGAEQQSDSHN